MTSKGEEQGFLFLASQSPQTNLAELFVCFLCVCLPDTVWSNTSVNSTHKPGLDHFPPCCSSPVYPVHPLFPLRNAFLAHYIGPIEEGEEMQRSSQTESCAGSSVI